MHRRTLDYATPPQTDYRRLSPENIALGVYFAILFVPVLIVLAWRAIHHLP